VIIPCILRKHNTALLAAFLVVTPLFLWAEIFRQKIFDDPQEWFSHPQNQIIAVFAGFILLFDR